MVIKVKTEPLSKPKGNKPKLPKAPTTNEAANTPSKRTAKSTKKATQDENVNPAASTAQQKAKQSKQKGTAVGSVATTPDDQQGMNAPADVPDHAALLARIRELEREFDIP